MKTRKRGAARRVPCYFLLESNQQVQSDNLTRLPFFAKEAVGIRPLGSPSHERIAKTRGGRQVRRAPAVATQTARAPAFGAREPEGPEGSGPLRRAVVGASAATCRP